MRRLLIAAVLSLLPLSAQAQNQGKLTVGFGNASCSAWARAHTSQPINVAQDQWLFGFLSGANLYTAGPNWFAITDYDWSVAWVTNYCLDHSRDSVADATFNLITELQKRAK